jgi:hypothetical protein
MMSRSRIVVGILVIVAAFLLFYPLYPVLRVANVKKAELLFCARMAENEEFVLSFIHSVNKRPVFDTLRIEGNQLLIVKSRFDSFGAGMPEGSQMGQDGWLEWVVNRPVPEVTLFVGWVANHSLRLKGREIPLADLAEPGTLLSLRVQKASRYGLWKGRCAQ